MSGLKATQRLVFLNITFNDNDIHTGYGTVWWLVCGATVSWTNIDIRLQVLVAYQRYITLNIRNI